MRFVDRILWLCLSLALPACSLVTEFPDALGDGGETGKRGDAGTHGGSAVLCEDNSDCDRNELCCAGGSDGKKRCQAARGDSQCTACGAAGACDPDRAPVCADRTCECEPGDGPCGAGLHCDTSGPRPRCVACVTDSHCANTAGRNECVSGECKACDPGNPDDPSDDQGCQGNTPICTPEGVCAGCRSDDDCGEGQLCNQGLGCFGCDIEKPIDQNGCQAANPVCRGTANGPQCSPCGSNDDCGGGFCNEGAGTCHMACDPPPLMPGQSSNGCTDPASPICKAAAGGDFACQRCVAGDPCPVPGQTCATVGPNAGQCVTMVSMCVPPATLVGGQCVQCTTSAQCAGNPAGPVCTANSCGPCTFGAGGDTACRSANAATPFCSMAGTCVACRTSAECSGNTPVCSPAGACIPCTASTTPAPDAACAAISRSTPACLTTGPAAGSCAACNPAVPCEFERGVPGFCYAAEREGPLVCNQCKRELPIGEIDVCTGLIPVLNIGNTCTDEDDGRWVCPSRGIGRR